MSVQCIRLLDFFFFGIGIAIGIGIDPISRWFHPHRMTYSFDNDPDFDLDFPNG